MKAPGDGLLHLLLKVSKVGFIISVLSPLLMAILLQYMPALQHIFFERDDQIERYFDLKNAEV